MSSEIIKTGIEAALSASGNNVDDAQKLLLTRAVRDPEFLLAIVRAQLEAIISRHMDRYLERFSTIAKGREGQKFPVDDSRLASLRISAEKPRKSSIPPPKSSDRQAFAMRKLADAFKKKQDR